MIHDENAVIFQFKVSQDAFYKYGAHVSQFHSDRFVCKVLHPDSLFLVLLRSTPIKFTTKILMNYPGISTSYD